MRSQSPRSLAIEKLEDRCLLSGGITEFGFPAGDGGPVDIATGPDGSLWFTQSLSQIDTAGADYIGRITPDGHVTEFRIPHIGFSFNGGAYLSLHITVGSDGNLWYTGANVIGRITTAGVVTEFSLLPEGADIAAKTSVDLTLGPDGNIWFTEVLQDFSSQEPAGKIARITPDGHITEYALPSPGSQPLGIVTGADGNLWFTEAGAVHKIGRITVSGDITEFTLPDADGSPSAIASGADGNLWFTTSNNLIGRITPNGDVTAFAIPSGSFASDITAGPDGNLYFTETVVNKIGRINTDGQIVEFDVPTNQSLPGAITTGPDGNIWFTEQFNSFSWETGSNQIGKFIVSVNGTPNQRYVSQLYLDLLHRPVDAIGLTTWVSMLDHGADRLQIVLGITNSREYHDVVIQNLYRSLLNRAAAQVELNAWQQYFAQGGTVQRAEAFVLGSDEYFAGHGNQFTSDPFLAAVYSDVLHRSLDTTGQQAWTLAVAQGMSRNDIALAILRSTEASRDAVDDLFGRLLHRQPDAASLNGYATLLQNGVSEELVTAMIAVSDEYVAQA
jgi:streptogramin lyase